MKRSSKPFALLAVVIAVSLFAGCMGGGSAGPKTYKLTVTVVNDANDEPLVGASVHVAGAGMASKTTDANGQAAFSGLKGSVEVLVEAVGFIAKIMPVEMDKDQSVTIRLETAGGMAVVDGLEELTEALEDASITDVVLLGDVDLADPLEINRPINMNLNGHEIKGDAQIEFEDEGEVTLGGNGSITGDLFVSAPNASVTNYIDVSGTIEILQVADETWHEHAQNNRLVVSGSSVRLIVHSGASSIEIAEDTWGVRVQILSGQVAELIANSGAKVTGAGSIVRAEVNAPGVQFDVSPQQIEGDFEPRIVQAFVPGSGGTIPEYVPSIAPPNTFSGLYVERNQRWPSWGGSTTGSPEVNLYFPPAFEFGGEGYALEYLDNADSTWKSYEGHETSSALSNNFSFYFWQTTTFRLRMMGGPMDGYTSNEVTVDPSPVSTYFSSWGSVGSMSSYVGETFNCYAVATRIAEGVAVSPEYMSYQWYRVDPVTYEMEVIAGATSTQYTAQEEDAGYALLLKASGDGEHIGGYVQMWAEGGPEIIKFPNKAFITDVTTEGFILNLYMNVPGLSPDDMELWAYGPSAPTEPLQIQSVDFLPGSQSRLAVTVDIPAVGIESLWLTAAADHWGIVSPSGHGGYIRPDVVYEF